MPLTWGGRPQQVNHGRDKRNHVRGLKVKNDTHSFHRRASATSHAKVRQLDFAALSVENENVLWLDISMDQLLTVQVVQSDGYLVHTALCHRLRKTNLKEGGDTCRIVRKRLINKCYCEPNGRSTLYNKGCNRWTYDCR